MLTPAYKPSPDQDDTHRKINYKLCNAIDLTGISITTDEMIKSGMEPELAEIFKTQADALLAAMRTENNRLKATRNTA